MGCCGNGRGNQGRVTEFNVHADPEAAEAVFACRWPRLTVSSWDLTTYATVPWRHFDGLLKARSKVGRFLKQVSHLPYAPQSGMELCKSHSRRHSLRCGIE